MRTDSPSSADDELPECLQGYAIDSDQFRSRWQIDAGQGYIKLNSNWSLEDCKLSKRGSTISWEAVFNMTFQIMFSLTCEGSDFSKMTVSDFFSETSENAEFCRDTKNASSIYAIKNNLKIDSKIITDGKTIESKVASTHINAHYADRDNSFVPCEYFVKQNTSTLKSPCKEISINIEQTSPSSLDLQEDPRMISKYDLDSKSSKVYEAGTIFSRESTSGKVLFDYNDWQGDLSYVNSKKPQKCTMKNATSAELSCLPNTTYTMTTASGSALTEEQKIIKKIEMISPMHFLPKRGKFLGK